MEGTPGGPARRQDIPAKSGSLVTQHSSGSLPVAGSLLEGKASSLDLGLLPPREMQVSKRCAIRLHSKSQTVPHSVVIARLE